MGTYYTFYNKTKNEFIDPFEVNDGSTLKLYSLIHSSTASIVLYAMAEGTWQGDVIELRGDGEDLPADAKNVGRELVDDYNEWVRFAPGVACRYEPRLGAS